MIKPIWFHQFDLSHPPTFDRNVKSGDTASKSAELADFTVWTTWGLKDKQINQVDVLRKRMVHSDLKRAVAKLRNRYGPDNDFDRRHRIDFAVQAIAISRWSIKLSAVALPFHSIVASALQLLLTIVAGSVSVCWVASRTDASIML